MKIFYTIKSKTLAVIINICDITKTNEIKKIISLLEKKLAFNRVEIINECKNVFYKVKVDNPILTISNVEVKND